MNKLEQFQKKAYRYIDELNTLFIAIPSKGDTEAECQRVCLINRLNDLQFAIAGTDDTDLKQPE